jgi:hypothetical protein
MQLLTRGKPVPMLKDRVKPAYMLNETDLGYYKPCNQRPSYKLHAPDVTYVSLLASAAEQSCPRWSDEGAAQIK